MTRLFTKVPKDQPKTAESRQQLILWRGLLLFTLILSIFAIDQYIRPLISNGLINALRWQLATGLWIAVSIVLLALFAATWTSLFLRLLSALEAAISFMKRFKHWNLLFFAIIIAAVSYLMVGPLGRRVDGIYTKIYLVWLVAASGVFFLRAAGFQSTWVELLAGSLLFAGFGYKIAAYLPDISVYPFTLGWSEASRYYYASLYFSHQIYGIDVSPTVLHPSRYLMQSIPYLIPNSPIWLHRLWQVVLWISTTWLAAWLLARRQKISSSLHRVMFVAWSFLFFYLGPVYYHLLVPVILILAWYDRRHPWRTGLVIVLASAWAGISRVNWFPVPGMLAAALYFLEEPAALHGTGFTGVLRYLLRPFLWTATGVAAAFGAQAAYALLSGNPVEQFASSFTSDLLWYRLFPSNTYPLGILPAALLVSLPFFYVLGYAYAHSRRSHHPIRWLGLATILLALFGGGLVVSAKIGGGSNLHNMDAYLTLLLVITAALFFGRFEPEPEAAALERLPTNPLTFVLGVVMLALPVYVALAQGTHMDSLNWNRAKDVLNTIRTYTQAAASEGGEVLFISERQLLTFHEIEGVGLIPDYEKIFLMEMAMSGNQAYLDKFHQDLKAQRFALILSEPLFTREKGSEHTFGEENDAWVQEVSKPVLCYYRAKRNLIVDVPLDILIPRTAIDSSCP